MEIRPILSALLRNKTGPVLVAVQVALSLAILANALHIVSVRQAVVTRPSGVAQEDAIFTLKVGNANVNAGFNELRSSQERHLALLRALPGVAAAAQINQVPLSTSGNVTSMSTDPKREQEPVGVSYYVSPGGLIDTWGLKLVEGRAFLPAETMEIEVGKSMDKPDVVIVTRALARKLWPAGGSHVGKLVYFGGGDSSARVVGVLERLQTTTGQVDEEGEWSILQPLRRVAAGAAYTVRAAPGQRDRVMAEAEAALRKEANNQVVIHAKTFDQVRADRYRADRGLAWMLVAVSVLLVLVTASGIVGMASLWVTQRRKQIGVRRALGARKVDILRYFITENVMITSAGVAGGVLGALALNHLLVTRLELARLPPGYLLAGAAVFFVLGIAAVYGPAWRAASTSPAIATRGVV
ncbi:putative ABC transport system permease protein [Pseudoduganella lurida]|uniref:Putative ABC transport system permease protein n=1 Tax=Pseudoduganella lurida TaxID=1036180 RepID=A0A562QV36_9BURK|nr:FtsX-like permease family protein [Pseudoduganella lurida]TWI60503.1 putative ABC transport system permease protein [Pseudoduganella lurida]